ncbi:hypothetical protein F4V57_10015 [Acinetobacter qingfengensis]|uniref:DUF4175 domain-containing protein n=1 Tax=Acinetobacter qingfengensis TaxID=1262585 RepID=A0A1E7R506_9GAMM|nr:hypothetical protein [Acinetobacter qingfengensis]KAA8732396.1 hypothetical protein F4V57_10015 [Acinetobacter qingfengensis]OEY94391.1 hypothetical protein BJI46_03350 [Acinetobacter qingfengensis]
MNAPRQGLFASLLIVSFALHSVLIVLATNYYLKDNRIIQGELLTRQLVADSLAELNPPNTVSLALLTSRYATNPSIASLRILDPNNQVLATAGANKTRDGDIFVRDAIANEQKVGRVEVTLIKPSLGETLRNNWLPLVASLIIHILLWIGYRTIARPTRSEFLAKMKREAQLKHEIQRLAEALEQEKHQATLTLAKAQQLYQNQRPKANLDVEDLLNKTEHSDHLYLSIQFYDPKQLLGSVNQRTAQAYFNLAQLFLNKTIKLCLEHFELHENQLEVIQPFFDDGALIRIDKTAPQAIPTIILVATVFQSLSDAMYKRYREDKRFALQTRSAIAEELPSMQLNAEKSAIRLAQYLHAKELAIYLSKPSFKHDRHCYELINLPNPSNALTREALLIQGLNTECAHAAEQMRDEILLGKKLQNDSAQDDS